MARKTNLLGSIASKRFNLMPVVGTIAFVAFTTAIMAVLSACSSPAPSASPPTQPTAAPVQPAAPTSAAPAQPAAPASPAPAKAAGNQAEGALIGYAAPSLGDIAQVNIQQGLLDGAAKLGMKTVTTNANLDVQKQTTDIDSLLSMGVKAIVAVPVDSAAIVPAVQKANNAVVPFFCIDRAADGGKIALTVTADNYLGGQQAGETMLKLLKAKNGAEKGTVLQLQGDLATNVAQQRGKGFEDALSKYPDVKIISKPTKWDPKVGADATQAVLTSNPDLDGIYWHSDAIGVGVIPALQQLNKLVPAGQKGHIIVVGFDATPQGLDYIRQESLDANISQPVYDYGIVAAQYVSDVLSRKDIQAGKVEQPGALWSPGQISQGKVGYELLMRTVVVDKSNVDSPALWANKLKH